MVVPTLNQSDLRPRRRREGVAGQRDVRRGPDECHRGDPTPEVTESVSGGHLDRLQGPESGPRRLDARDRDRSRPGVVRVARTRHADRVTRIDHRREGPGGAIAAGRGRVLGRCHRPPGEFHDDPGRVGHREVGDRGLVREAAVGLTGEVAHIGVAPVGAEPGHHERARGDRLGFELLEAPGVALRPGPAEGPPSRRRLVRDNARHVLLERNDVDRPGRTVGVVRRLDRAPYGEVAADLAELERFRPGLRVSESGIGARLHGRVGECRPGGPGPTASRTDRDGPHSAAHRSHQHGLTGRNRDRGPGDREGRTRGDDRRVAVVLGERDAHQVRLLPGRERHRRRPAVVVVEDRLVAGPAQRVAERAPLAHPVTVAEAVTGERDRRGRIRSSCVR